MTDPDAGPEDLQAEIVEQFTLLCGDPDNTEVAAAADRALLALDAALAR